MAQLGIHAVGVTASLGLLRRLVVRSPPADAGGTVDLGWIPGLGRPTGEGNGNLQYSGLENPTGSRRAGLD